MALNPGTKLGSYEILASLGAGAMGEVYRARDTALQRDVAIKILPAAVAENPRRLMRFEREARALGALNHPNIASVYSVHEPAPGSGQPAAIVMELVSGDDLSWRLAQGRLARAEALEIARQVAEALAAAHHAGLVHRDLKPANIKLRADGVVKVLDFGLATAGSYESDVESEPEDSGSNSAPGELPPTVTTDPILTRDGAIVGTASYMAPEQAKGQRVDKRADIWAFGVLVFEMLAARRPFDAANAGDASETIARVLAAEPVWTALPSDTPASIRRLLARCLTKDRKHRLHDIADARLEIDEAITATSERATAETRAASLLSWWAIGPALLALVAGLAAGRALWRTTPVPPLVTHAHVDAGPADEITAGGVHPAVVLPVGGARTALAWSPDGRTLGFIGAVKGVRQIYLRDLSSTAARALAGTENARALAFSPSGDEVAFWSDGALRKVNVAGGPIVTLADSVDVNGISWGATRIVVSRGRLWSMDATSGDRQMRQITFPDELVRHASPELLPGDAAVLFTEYRKQWTSGDECVMVQSLAPGATPRVLLTSAADPHYLSTGHIAFMRQGALFVVGFDAKTLEIRGEPVSVTKDVSQAVVAWDSSDLTLAGQFAISPQGTLAYLSSPLASYPDRELVMVDRQGQVTPLGAPARGYRSGLSVSPDDTKLAVSIQTTTDIQLFVYDVARHTLSRVADTLKGELMVTSWSPDNRLAVLHVNDGKVGTAIVRSDAAEALEASVATVWPGALSVTGRLAGMKAGELWIYSLNNKTVDPFPLMTTKASELQPQWSPAGDAIAYTSDATGRQEVYVRPFPTGGTIMVSTNGASSPMWNPTGDELFYLEPGPDQDRMMAVAIPSVGSPGAPRPLFSIDHNGWFQGTSVVTPYAVGKNGQRFYTVRTIPRATVRVGEVHVVFNWFEDLRKKGL